MEFILKIELDCIEECNGCPLLKETNSRNTCLFLKEKLFLMKIKRMSGQQIVTKRHKDCPLIEVNK